jgi:hypothetical protein
MKDSELTELNQLRELCMQLKADNEALRGEVARLEAANDENEVGGFTTHDIAAQANQIGRALSESESDQILKQLRDDFDGNYGINWEIISAEIRDSKLGRPLTEEEKEQVDENDMFEDIIYNDAD